jgi:membrane-associated phospholipid phosphatase
MNMVNSLDKKDSIPGEDVALPPEIELHGIWKKFFTWIYHIPHAFWPMIGMVLFVLLLTFMPHFLWVRLWLAMKEHVYFVVLVLIFGFISVSLLWTVGQRLDVWVFKLLNVHGRRTTWLDELMLAFTQIGSGLFILVVILVLYFGENHILAYELTMGALSLGLVVELIKAIIHRTRPFIKLKDIRIVGSRASGRSFPSGHTSQTFFMASVLLHYYQAGFHIWLLLYVIASLVGITRIYLGMHYPRDVLAGAMLGTAWGLVGVIFNNHMWGYG